MSNEDVDSSLTNRSKKEQAIRAMQELGSVPVAIFQEIVNQLDRLPNQTTKVLTVLTSLMILLASCNMVPEPYEKPAWSESPIIGQFQKVEPPIIDLPATETAEAWEPFSTPEETEIEESYQPEEFFPNWQLGAVIQEGEGVVAALSRVAGMQAKEHDNVPEGYIQVIIIYHLEGPPEVYDWKNLSNLNPVVWPGDRVVHTFLTTSGLREMQDRYLILKENTHIN